MSLGWGEVVQGLPDHRARGYDVARRVRLVVVPGLPGLLLGGLLRNKRMTRMTDRTWEFHRYRVTLRHDGGVTVLDTVARDADTARMIVCNAESAPPSAVVWTEKLPD